MIRKNELINNEYYHVFNRSIAKFKIFNHPENYYRFISIISYYQYENNILSYSKFLESSKLNLINSYSGIRFVDIVAYCIMPTHFHLILKQNINNGISIFLSKVQNSYSKYFNTIYKRRGPLWESRFQNIHIETDEQLLHLTRYIHLNPSSAGLVKKPEDWEYSSYYEYINSKTNESICVFENILNIKQKEYKIFIDDRVSYQKELSIIKSQLIDNYTG
ncbi:MAG: hypothetical protein UR93_C0009G0021 [Berkelbacteria bacterium GW2011_GWA2_35_9]|uniref:Transposase IS200-like domain-containing protein n=1 Tax=Berkelbacteria bacterium GW2011_GWA2_35_9 TaxID=1618333 RepID=A0A0G0D648_9BACT|nr:MAG: hypothetical protein UR93_C0009G0021 [Berkelbacteria bacterium GW2011_GWA2_35_9]